MTVTVDLKMDVRKLNRDLHKLSADLRDKATSMAINKLAAKGKTEMNKAIRSEFRLSAAEVRARLNVRRAWKGHLEATLFAFDSPTRPGKRAMNLIRFLENRVSMAQVRKRKKDGSQNVLRFRIKKGGAPKTIRGAFIGNKGRTVFRRIDQGDSRSKIEAVSTVGVQQMFNTRTINHRVVKFLRKEFPIEFERASQQALRQFNRKR